MPFFEGIVVNGQPIIDVAITLPNADAITDENMFRALVDTGANITSVSEQVAHKLNLTSLERREMGGATGKEVVPVHRVALHIPITKLYQTQKQTFKQEHWYHIHSTEVAEISGLKEIFGLASFDVLLGTDILYDCHFTMFNGKFTLGF